MDRSAVRHAFGQTIRVASIHDLIALKRVADRPKDRNHIIELESLAALARQEPNPEE